MGRDSDRDVPAYQPNKDRRMSEWRKKKDAERAAAKEERRKSLEKKGQEEAAKAAEKEERNEGKVVEAQPITQGDPELAKALETPQTGAPEVKPRRPSRRAHFEQHPTLFDEVK